MYTLLTYTCIRIRVLLFTYYLPCKVNKTAYIYAVLFTLQGK